MKNEREMFIEAKEFISQGDIQNAICILEELAYNDNAESVEYLASLYLDKNSDLYNIRKGVSYLKQGKRADSIYCISNLAYCYLNGIGVPKNEEVAFELYYNAAIENDSDSQLIVAEHYLNKNDTNNYLFWITKSIKNGNEIAQLFYDHVLENNIKLLQDKKQELTRLNELRDKTKRFKNYQKIKDRLNNSLRFIPSIIYEKKLDNKVHFWRGNKL